MTITITLFFAGKAIIRIIARTSPISWLPTATGSMLIAWICCTSRAIFFTMRSIRPRKAAPQNVMVVRQVYRTCTICLMRYLGAKYTLIFCCCSRKSSCCSVWTRFAHCAVFCVTYFVRCCRTVATFGSIHSWWASNCHSPGVVLIRWWCAG